MIRRLNLNLNLAWAPYVFSLEVRKILSYRVDFWVQLLASVLVEWGIAYFLWSAIFANRGASQFGGYTLPSLMLYYLLMPIFGRMLRGQDWNNGVAEQIYAGGLNRYLVYPVPFFPYLFMSKLANYTVCLVQLAGALGLYLVLMGLPPGVHISFGHMAMGLSSVFFGTVLYFSMSAALELVAFWAENVWSLSVMLSFCSMLLGGAFIPLNLFPAWAQSGLRWLPFSQLLYFPARVFMGQVGVGAWLGGLAISFGWSVLFFGLVAWVWRRGIRQYSGVGI